jgi:phosphonate transport system ATP-binding protein
MNLPAIINIHDVVLAQNFTDRIIGLQAGKVVFDGLPSALSHEALTRIYGAEDWGQMQQANEPQDDDTLLENSLDSSPMLVSS